MKDQIQYSGLRNLSAEEQAVVRKLVEDVHPRIKRTMREETRLKVNIKVHNTKGERKRYELSLRATSGKKVFSRSEKGTSVKKSPAWDITSAVRRAIEELESEIKHKMNADSEYWKKESFSKAMDKSRLNE